MQHIEIFDVRQLFLVAVSKCMVSERCNAKLLSHAPESQRIASKLQFWKQSMLPVNLLSSVNSKESKKQIKGKESSDNELAHNEICI